MGKGRLRRKEDLVVVVRVGGEKEVIEGGVGGGGLEKKGLRNKRTFGVWGRG